MGFVLGGTTVGSQRRGGWGAPWGWQEIEPGNRGGSRLVGFILEEMEGGFIEGEGALFPSPCNFFYLLLLDFRAGKGTQSSLGLAGS